MMAGVNMLHVPFRGAAPALTDLLGGQVQVMFEAVPSVDRARSSGQASCLGSDDRDARRCFARCPADG